jgi:hypothetical protein
LNGRHTTASHDRIALTSELVWRQHSRLRLHRSLTLRSPSGTLGMGVATRVTMIVVVTTPLTVTPSLASESEPPPLPGTLTGTLLWSDTLVMGDEVESACSQVTASKRLLHTSLASVHQNTLRSIWVNLKREKTMPAFLWLPPRSFIPHVFCFHSSCLGVAWTCLCCWER